MIGGSMAGLLAARALAGTYEEVLIVDRDVLPSGPVHRAGVPQSRHAHWLLAGGLEALESFFPGISGELVAEGATSLDPQQDCAWFFDGHPVERAPSDMTCLMMSRTLLESRVRARTEGLPGVRTLPRHEVTGLLATTGGGRIDGVRAVRRGRPGPVLELRADLVVDASGRASRTPLWLRELGYRPPREDRVRVGVTYVTRRYRRASHHLPGILAIGRHVTPDRRRGAALYPSEDGCWMVTLAGVLDQEPPLDTDAFTAYGCSLGDPGLRQILGEAEPLDVPVRARFPEAFRRRYERLRRPPEGLVVIGDAMCATNPTLAHGMSVAALQAQALRDCLRTGTAGLARRYHRRAARVLTVPWTATRTSDVGPYASGRRRSAFLWAADLARTALCAAMERDAAVTRACLRLAHLTRGRRVLFSPRVLAGVVSALARLALPSVPSGQGGGPPSGRPPQPRRTPDRDHEIETRLPLP
ncbi:NAD(P)/FAD-dependent oxidoreductase [Streptomyces sp. 4F14]|uniref:NAD(P)/FAD-dependent oxidoreductase n=1 Tax=Streptomyces sp. 4F14 TaxID=3394380 RepID=UPI003A8A1C76